MTPGEQIVALERALLEDGIAAVGASFAHGGGAGARFAAKRLREDRAELRLEVSGTAGDVRGRVAGLLSSLGELVPEPLPATETPEVWAMVGGGVGGMNPVVVRVAVEAPGEGRSRLTVRAVAKEGLIKQRAGQKTAARVHEELTRVFGAWPIV